MNDKRENRKRYPLFLPLLLITLGIILLWQNLGGQEIDAWELLFKFWPVILIFAGLEGLYQRQFIGVGIFWCTFGLALLLSNLGRISWTLWEIILGLWPVFIIGLGLDVMFSRQNYWGKFAAGGIVLLLMGSLVWYFDTQSISSSLDQTKIEQMLEDIDRAVINIKPSVSFLKIFAQGSEASLVEGKLLLWNGERIRQDYQVENNTGTYELASTGLAFIYEPGIDNRADWAIGISSRLPIELNLNQIVGEISLELSDLKIDAFSSVLVIGVTEVTLPRQMSLSGNIDQTVGRIMITVPEGIEFELTGIPIVGSIDYPDSYIREGSRIRSPRFGETEHQVSLDVNLTVGTIIVRQR